MLWLPSPPPLVGRLNSNDTRPPDCSNLQTNKQVVNPLRTGGVAEKLAKMTPDTQIAISFASVAQLGCGLDQNNRQTLGNNLPVAPGSSDAWST